MMRIKRNRSLQVLASSVVLIAGIPVLGHAWGNTWMGINLERTISSLTRSIGPAKVDASFRLTSGGYDSSLYFGSMGEPVDDFTFRAGPDIRIYLPLQKRFVLEVREYPHYSFFAKTEKERAWNNVFGAGLHLVFKNVYFKFNYDRLNVKERLNSEVFINVRRKEETGRALFLWQMSKGISVEIQGGTSRFAYEDATYGDDNIRANLNRTERTASLTAYFQGVKGVRFHLTGSYGQYRFALVPEAKDSSSASVFGGVEFLQVGGFQGSINLGFKFFNMVDPVLKDYQGPVGNVRLAVRVMKLTELGALFERDVVFSVWTESAYFVQTIWGAELSRLLSKQIRLSYTFGYGTNDYSIPLAGVVESPEGWSDAYFLHSAALLFRLQKNLDLTLGANWRTRTHSWQEFEDHRSFYGLDLVYRF